MSVKLGSNIASLSAQRRLSDARDQTNSAIERLASGQRINSAVDDAAGLAISEALSSKSRVYTQALRNVSDGLSALNIAQGAVQQLSAITIRQLELAEQAANGTYTQNQRRAMNEEANALVNEFNRIVTSTEFNGVFLTDRQRASQLSIQAGFGTNGSLHFTTNQELSRNVGTGAFSSAVTFSEYSSTFYEMTDLNRDGVADIIFSDTGLSTLHVALGNGNGTYKSSVSFADRPSTIDDAVIGDVNGDGLLDVITSGYGTNSLGIFFGNGNGTFKAVHSIAIGDSTLSAVSGDVNGDGILDIAVSSYSTFNPTILIGNGNGTFKVAMPDAPDIFAGEINFLDYDDDGLSDIVGGIGSGPDSVTDTLLLSNGDGTFRYRALTEPSEATVFYKKEDVNRDGLGDLISVGSLGIGIQLGNGNGSYKAATHYAGPEGASNVQIVDINGDGNIDLASQTYTYDGPLLMFIGNGDGSFRASYSVGNLSTYSIGDTNNDGVADIIGRNSDFTTSLIMGNGNRVSTSAYLNLNSRAGALQAINTLDATLQRINGELSTIGSAQSRLYVAARNLSVSRENYLAASSRIKDVDVAEETGRLVRGDVLQNVAAAVMAQANQAPALALRLLS